MNRLILSVALVTVLGACGIDADSREDFDSHPIGETADETTSPATPTQSERATPTQSERATPTQSERAAPTQAERAAPTEPVRAIPAGAVLTFEVRESVSTSSHVAGDAFSLALVDAVTGTAGAVLPAGTSARGVVTDARKSSGPDDEALLAVRIASVEVGGSQKAIEGEVQSTAIESSTRDSGARTAATIATGTAAGAVIGQILGGDTRSTVTGAAAGTAVGVVVALTTRGGDATLPQGSRIAVQLDRDLVY